MKKSRIAKFALLGASAAALAATLSTSTYAWYVSNKTANVNAVTGKTDSAAGDGSISLSTSGKSNEYFKTITLASTANYNGYVSGNAEMTVLLAPVCTTNGTTFLKDDGTAAAATSYYKYEFYVKSEEACEIIPTITVINTTTQVPSQINYSAATTSTVTGVQKGAAFTIDALYSLYMSQSTEIGKQYSSTQTAYAAAESQTGAITAQGGAVMGGTNISGTLSTDIANSDFEKATAGAHAYYKEIMGSDAAHTTPWGSTATAIGNITLAANTPQKVTYYLWLDGADDQCFNSCAGQQFTVAFSYTVKANNNG